MEHYRLFVNDAPILVSACMQEPNKVKQTMKTPELIKQGNKADTFMFYKFFPKTIVSPKHLVLVIKYFNTEGALITGYFTERIRKGEILWKKQ